MGFNSGFKGLILGHTHAETWTCFGHKMTKE